MKNILKDFIFTSLKFFKYLFIFGLTVIILNFLGMAFQIPFTFLKSLL